MRIQVTMHETELRALDRWRAQHQVWSRAEAVRRLVAAGVKGMSAELGDEFAEGEG